MSNKYFELKNLIKQADELFRGIEKRPDSLPIYKKALLIAQNLNKELEINYILSKIAIINKKPKEALTYLKKVIQIKPDLWEGWHYTGLAYDHLGKFKEAIESYDKALEYKSSAWSLYNKGITFEKMGMHEKAILNYNKTLEIDPNHARALNNKGIILSDLKNFDEALNCLNEAVLIDEKYAYAWDTKGVILNKMGRHAEALDCFDIALELDPENTKILINKAITLGELEKIKDSIELAEKAKQIDPNFASAWNTVGVGHSRLHQYETALDNFKKAKDLDPNKELYISNVNLIETILSTQEEKKQLKIRIYLQTIKKKSLLKQV